LLRCTKYRIVFLSFDGERKLEKNVISSYNLEESNGIAARRQQGEEATVIGTGCGMRKRNCSTCPAGMLLMGWSAVWNRIATF